jgi:hypothetical protein
MGHQYYFADAEAGVIWGHQTNAKRNEDIMKKPNDIIINEKQLSEILEKHYLWLINPANEGCANLRGADLSNARLRDANLSCADLSNAYLRGADLSNANLSNAYLRGADLSNARLRDANLSCADLSNADLSNAYLTDARNTEIALAKTIITPDGDIIGWKKCAQGVIVKLLIPADAKRSNATGRKCRAEYAVVLDVIGAKYGYTHEHGPRTEYRVGQIVRPDRWDENRFNECSNGIHFFLTRIEAEMY